MEVGKGWREGGGERGRREGGREGMEGGKEKRGERGRKKGREGKGERESTIDHPSLTNMKFTSMAYPVLYTILYCTHTHESTHPVNTQTVDTLLPNTGYESINTHTLEKRFRV